MHFNLSLPTWQHQNTRQSTRILISFDSDSFHRSYDHKDLDFIACTLMAMNSDPHTDEMEVQLRLECNMANLDVFDTDLHSSQAAYVAHLAIWVACLDPTKAVWRHLSMESSN